MQVTTRRKKAAVLIILTAAVVVMSAFNPLDLPNVGSAVPVNQFVNFESAHVHPLDITPDGTKLLAVNTANNTLEIFQITTTGLLNTASIPVGMDPVTVRVRSNTEAWVVNQVSDDISIVDLTLKVVTRSLATEDEPADVVFTPGTSPPRAFVSCAQRESVQVFNTNSLGTAPTEILLKGEQPRALAVNAAGTTVYTAFFESGNQTTVIAGNPFIASGICSVQGGCTIVANDVTKPAGPYGGVVPIPNAGTSFNPPMNIANPSPGSQSIIVRKNVSNQWMDDNAHNWTNIVTGGAGVRTAGWDMPDRDVAVLDANSLALSYQAHLGNILMAMAVNPATGQVNVVGTDATNEIRFEPVLKGKFLRVNISQFTTVGGANTITDLNPHINYANSTLPIAERNKSIGDPRGIAFKSDGSKLYVTGMGSNNVVVLNSNGTRNLVDPINVGEGPTGIVLDEARNKAYVLNKFEGTISSVNLVSNKEVARANFFDPTPMVIKVGRKHLYNTHLNSGNGHIACASCHVDGRWDRLGWDLGDPSGAMAVVDGKTFHPMKGVKTTQFLIDIIGRGRGNLHWRGDRHGFEDFAGAFQNLQGTDAPKDAAGMQEFKDFLAASWYVPNPYRTYKPETTVAAATERCNPNRVRGIGTAFQTIPSAGVKLWVSVHVNCSHCHNAETGRGELAGNGNVAGTGPTAGFSQNLDMAPDLRTVYRKNGFFYNTSECTSGFGLLSDGIMETVFDQVGTGNYLGDYEPELMSWSGGITEVNDPLSFSFPLANHLVQDAMPAVGLHQTINGSSIGSVAQVDAMKALVDDANHSSEYGMIVKGIYGGEPRGFYYLGSGNYQSDISGQTVTHTQLAAAAQTGSQPLSWLLVQPTTTVRLGVDRDADGILDHDDKPAMVQIRADLEGAMNGASMRHDLADQVLLPAIDPGGSGAQASPQVLAYTGVNAPVDWVKVELRNSANNTQVLASGAALLQANGNLIMPTGEQTLTFPSVPAASYYIVIDHRNHLAAMTASAISLVNMGTQVDFTLPATPTWGTGAQKNVGGTMVLWAGDVIGDGVVKYTGGNNDRDPILLKIGGTIPTNTVPGYWPEDVNLNGVVKYSGGANDRDPILVNIGGTVPTNTKVQQLP